MKLSIITCTYNSEKYLQECIDSVITQDLDTHKYEHIFVDAYSTDNTSKIINDYQKKYHNVKLIKRKPKGVYNAMNEGIKEACGKYVLCLNSDDFLEKNNLKKYLEFVDKNGDIDLYYGKVALSKDGKIITIFNRNKIIYLIGRLFFRFGAKALIHHPSVLLKRETFLELGGFDEQKKISSDYGFWLNMMAHNKSFKFFPYVISNFRIHGKSLSSGGDFNKLMLEEDRYFQRKYLHGYKKWTSFLIEKICVMKGKIVLGK